MLRGEYESGGARAQPSLERLRWTGVESVTAADLCHTCISSVLCLARTPHRRRRDTALEGGAGCFRQACESRPLAHRKILPLHYHRPQPCAVKNIPGLDSGVKSKQNQSYLPLCTLADQDREARKIHALRLQFASSSSALYLPVIIASK